MEKVFFEAVNIGKVKYVVTYHDGIQTHEDGSPFFAIATFSNKVKRNQFVQKLRQQGYVNPN